MMHAYREAAECRAEAPCGYEPREEIVCPGNTFVIRVRLTGGRVVEAWSTGKMMRNMGVILKGELDASGHARFVQQAHCLCNDGHALAAVRAIENLAGMEPSREAQLVRGLVQSLRCVQEHLLHVYQFHLDDWASLSAALRADPANCARLAPRSPLRAQDYRQAQTRLEALAHGQGIAKRDGESREHPEYRGAPEFHLTLRAHGLESLAAQGAINAALKLLDCGPNGFKAYHVGGLPENLDLCADVRCELRKQLAQCRDFVTRTFLPDLELLARTYAHIANLGAGSIFLCGDDYGPRSEAGAFFPGGLVCPPSAARDGSDHWTSGPALGPVHEEHYPRWSLPDRNRYRLTPSQPGPLFRLDTGAFAWLPVPRHGEEACEVGALSRIMGAWASNRDGVQRVMQRTMDACGLTPAALNSTLGRILSRGVESAVLAEAALGWLDELESLPAVKGTRACDDPILPSSGVGTGVVEVPRGTLTHTIRLEERRIAAHDYLIPSLWNFSPRDSQGQRGPLERALLGAPVSSPERPLEILRTVHELDPCNACLVVIENADTGDITTVSAK
ncbi:Ni,Fe-hydrogenase I large subunit [Desulfobaculum xiamenense]|uniref:Ni,Fe-hydrogenase I large subunit n=1 Tax=Desulfobaculum xiamenense TaxID=995050 RepID=A0A846QHA6_9BACT|nr:nickel-dependent hydrogenase large subunit [Desulfobaculum xiamenense]NJB68206.1 Ni,Fe-hydrogenase I large subunit [Desulfobaculum xiamenense]